MLVEKTHEAWRAYRVLSLVSFDVQGAFNGVRPSILAERLRERRIPGDLVAWIESFRNMTINNPAYQKSFEALQSCSGNEYVKSSSSKDSMRASFSLDTFTIVPMAHHVVQRRRVALRIGNSYCLFSHSQVQQ